MKQDELSAVHVWPSAELGWASQ